MTKIFTRIIIVAILLSGAYVIAEEGLIWNFEQNEIGELPPGWKVEATNLRGEIATWEVAADSVNGEETQVLGMTKANDDFGGTFNICRTDSAQFKDGEIEVRFKAISGVEDQGGGPIWRVQDANNYYIARANPLENNFRLYYVKDGARKTLDSERLDVPANQWHTIKIVHQGNRMEGYLNGKKYLEWEDSTFPETGGVGVWTKADAITYFDDFTVRAAMRNKQNKSKGKK